MTNEMTPNQRQQIELQKRFLWLKNRQTGIGGSDIAIILNKSTFKKDKLELYYSKKEELKIEDVKAPEGYAKTGVDLEESTLRDYEDLKGVTVTRGEYNIYRHKEYPELIASVDGFDEKNNTVVEVKVITHPTKKQMWVDANGEYQIPAEYLLQVAHYCSVVDADKADVIVRFMPSNEEVILTYERDKELEKIINNAALYFWKNYVQAKREPRITMESYDTALRGFNIEEENPKITLLPEHMLQYIENIKEAEQEIKVLEKSIKTKKAEILDYCKDKQTSHLYASDGKARLVSVIPYKGRAGFDSKMLKEENPDIYEKYTKQGNPYNVLKLKKGE